MNRVSTSPSSTDSTTSAAAWTVRRGAVRIHRRPRQESHSAIGKNSPAAGATVSTSPETSCSHASATSNTAGASGRWRTAAFSDGRHRATASRTAQPPKNSSIARGTRRDGKARKRRKSSAKGPTKAPRVSAAEATKRRWRNQRIAASSTISPPAFHVAAMAVVTSRPASIPAMTPMTALTTARSATPTPSISSRVPSAHAAHAPMPRTR